MSETITLERKPQLVHTARQMFETRLAKYNDPHNLEWDFDDVTDKWERHAFSAFMDLQAAEARCDELEAALREAVYAVGGSRKASVGSINNILLPQIGVDQVARWRAVLSQQTDNLGE